MQILTKNILKSLKSKMRMKKKMLSGKLSSLLLAVVIALVGVLMASCATPKPVVSENTSDRFVEREKVDSLIGIAADSARAHLALACDSIGNVYVAEINTLQGERSHLQRNAGPMGPLPPRLSSLPDCLRQHPVVDEAHLRG